MTEIARKFGISTSAVKYLNRTRSIRPRVQEGVGNEKYDEIIALYKSGMSVVKVAEAAGVCASTVHCCICGNKANTRTSGEALKRIKCNESKFDEINENSAYWAGFLMADGCIHASRSAGAQQVVSVALKGGDIGHIQKFASFMECDAKITVSNSAGSFGGKTTLAKIAITSQRVVDALRRFGLGENKTYTALANSRVEFNRHFWRGMVDGDGCVMATVNRNGKAIDKPSVKLVGTKAILKQFANFVSRVVDGGRPRVVRCSRSVIYECVVSSSRARQLVRVLYSNCNISLDRKLDRAKEIMNQPPLGLGIVARRKNMNAAIGMAWCGSCKAYLEKSKFYKSKHRINGRSSRCKECSCRAERERYRKTKA